MKLNFTEAKQMVAERHGKPNFTFFYHEPSGPDQYYQEAVELLAQSWANEAVREDRVDIALAGDHNNLDIHSLVNNRPLPYTESE